MPYNFTAADCLLLEKRVKAKDIEIISSQPVKQNMLPNRIANVAAIAGVRILLNSGFPRAAHKTLSAVKKQHDLTNAQRTVCAELSIRVESDLQVEEKYGEGALMNPDSDYTKYELRHGRISALQLKAMNDYQALKASLGDQG